MQFTLGTRLGIYKKCFPIFRDQISGSQPCVCAFFPFSCICNIARTKISIKRYHFSATRTLTCAVSCGLQLRHISETCYDIFQTRCTQAVQFHTSFRRTLLEVSFGYTELWIHDNLVLKKTALTGDHAKLTFVVGSTNWMW